MNTRLGLSDTRATDLVSAANEQLRGDGSMKATSIATAVAGASKDPLASATAATQALKAAAVNHFAEFNNSQINKLTQTQVNPNLLGKTVLF